MMQALRVLMLAVAVALGGIAATAVQAHAQDKPSAAERRAARRAAARAKKKAKEPDKPAQEAKPVPESAAAAAPPPAPPPALDDATVRKEGETEVKTVEFTGLDIEGQLKTPQLLYFLTRLRAEFGRPRLPHRSFMPELSRTSGEKALR